MNLKTEALEAFAIEYVIFRKRVQCTAASLQTMSDLAFLNPCSWDQSSFYSTQHQRVFWNFENSSERVPSCFLYFVVLYLNKFRDIWHPQLFPELRELARWSCHFNSFVPAEIAESPNDHQRSQMINLCLCFWFHFLNFLKDYCTIGCLSAYQYELKQAMFSLSFAGASVGRWSRLSRLSTPGWGFFQTWGCCEGYLLGGECKLFQTVLWSDIALNWKCKLSETSAWMEFLLKGLLKDLRWPVAEVWLHISLNPVPQHGLQKVLARWPEQILRH